MLRPLQTTVICHFYNEEFLLPHWLNQHTRLFDNGLMINYRSTDRSVEIIKEMAPHWEIVDTRNDCFRCIDVDNEVMDYEKMIAGWKICLNVTEFLFIEDLKSRLVNLERENRDIAKFKGFEIIDNPAVDKPFEYDKPLIFQRFNAVNTHQRNRTIHKRKTGKYCWGRHQTEYDYNEEIPLIKRGFLFGYNYSPYPEQVERKLKMSKCIPPEDIEAGRGYQHYEQKNEKVIYETWNAQIPDSFNILEATNNCWTFGPLGSYVTDILSDLQALYNRDNFSV